MKNIESVNNGDRLISAAKVCEILGFAKATMHRRLRDDAAFPAPMRLGKTGTIRFWLSDVLRYANGNTSPATDVKAPTPVEPASQPVPNAKDENPTQKVQVEPKEPAAAGKIVGGHDDVKLTQNTSTATKKNPLEPSRRKTFRERYVSHAAFVKLIELKAQEQAKNPAGDGTDSARDGGSA